MSHLYLKVLLTTLLCFMSSLCAVSQNASYRVIYEDIYPLLDTNYGQAKLLWTVLEEQADDIDPSEQEIMLGYALKNGDIEFFKLRIDELIQKYNWQYSACIDTLPWVTEKSMLKQLIKEHSLVSWIQQTMDSTEKISPESCLNPFFMRAIDDLISSDRTLTKVITRSFSSEDGSSGSSLADSISAVIDFEHIERIALLCKLNNNEMPNNFENGIGIYNKISFIIWHNLKSEKNFLRTWNLLFPYIGKAYSRGKISYTLFMAYDQWSVHHFGVQYYGTMEGEPVRDPESLDERRKKYGLYY